VLAAALLCLFVVGVRGVSAAILVVDDDGMATVADCNDAAPAFPTISSAVAVASDGDTITVCPGTYVENIVLNKRLTLLGPFSGVDACGRVAAATAEAVVSSAPIPGTRTLELRLGSAGSTIDGFTFSTSYRAIESTSGPITDLGLLNNRVRDFTNAGVFLNDTGLNITANQNEIDGTMKVGGGGLFHLDTDNFDGFWFTNNCVVNGITGTGFFVDGNRNVGASGTRLPRFSGNFIDNNGTGTNLGRRSWEEGPIVSNTFSNNRFDGLQGGPKDSLIGANTFDSNGRSGLALTGFFAPTALVPTDPDPTRGAQGNQITQNCFTANGFLVPPTGAGISFSATQFPGTISSNVANLNNIFGNAIGARYLGPETINAEHNWWGSPTGPTHVNNPGGMGDPVVDDGDGIDYDPFRTTPAGGTPCIPTPPPAGKVTGGGQINVVNGRGSFGFNARQDENGVGSGHLTYHNHATGAQLNCTVTAITMLTTTTAEFSGTCTADSASPSFSAHVEDHGEPGAQSGDKFIIMYPAAEGGTIRSGNIQIHK
jgi:hypothetical protein